MVHLLLEASDLPLEELKNCLEVGEDALCCFYANFDLLFKILMLFFQPFEILFGLAQFLQEDVNRGVKVLSCQLDVVCQHFSLHQKSLETQPDLKDCIWLRKVGACEADRFNLIVNRLELSRVFLHFLEIK